MSVEKTIADGLGSWLRVGLSAYYVANAIIRTLERAGYAVVPIEPTARMIDCGTPNLGIAEHAWKAMVSARPKVAPMEMRWGQRP
jgi:hypothetical protein